MGATETQPVEVTNWPAPVPGSYQLVTLPSGQVARVDYTASFGELFLAAAIILALVIHLGGRLFDWIRGVQ